MTCAVNYNRSLLEAPIDVHTNNICCNDPECVLPYQRKIAEYEYYHRQGKAQEGCYVYGLLYLIWLNMCFRIQCHLHEAVVD